MFMNNAAKKYYQGQLLKKQQGNILVIFTIGLFALIAMAALALDGGHMLLNKSRLQNITDAAALHAAKTLEGGGNHDDARIAVLEIITLNLAHKENFEIYNELDMSAEDTETGKIIVEFSERADPFEMWTDEDKALYVKVEIRNINLNNFLADILSFSKQVSATALAGPSAAIEDCYNNLVPMMVCGAFDADGVPLHAGDVDGNGDPTHAFGLPLKKLYALKIGAGADSPIGPGNFQFIDLGNGKNTVRDMLAGADINETDVCFSPNEGVPTEPGNAVGPNLQGLNTRMEVNKKDEAGYPRDLNTCQGPAIDFDLDLDASGAVITSGIEKAYRYEQYLSDAPDVCENVVKGDVTGDILPKSTDIGKRSERRILNIVIGDCTGEVNGKGTIPYKGTGCFFLTQDIDNGGQESFVIGEFVEDCSIRGTPSGSAIDGNDTIVLFHVPGSSDS
jgi:hypothetical protein